MISINNFETVLGMNSRNIDFIYPSNNRYDFHLVDNKLETKKILREANLPHPKLINSYEWFWQLQNLENDLISHNDFVIKPARGFAGGGIMIVNNKTANGWETASGELITFNELKRRATDILYGVFSIDNSTDIVIIEEKIVQHHFFNTFYNDGIADIRVIVYNNNPVMAMCRIPSKKSDGKANVTLGAIGVGIDINTGEMFHAVDKTGVLDLHPDTQVPLVGSTIPYWSDILSISKKIPGHFPLGYIGVDIVIDEDHGPLVLELNARPGLEIQNANNAGLKKRLQHSYKETI